MWNQRKALTMEITQKRLQWNPPELDREGVGGASPESVRAVRRPGQRWGPGLGQCL